MIYGYMLNESTIISEANKISIDSIVQWLNNDFIPKLLTESYKDKIAKIVSSFDGEDYYNSDGLDIRECESDEILEAESLNNKISFTFMNQYTNYSSFRNIGNKLDFVFNDICKGISNKFKINAHIDTNRKTFSIILILYTNESTMISEAVSKNDIPDDIKKYMDTAKDIIVKVLKTYSKSKEFKSILTTAYDKLGYGPNSAYRKFNPEILYSYIDEYKQNDYYVLCISSHDIDQELMFAEIKGDKIFVDYIDAYMKKNVYDQVKKLKYFHHINCGDDHYAYNFIFKE